LILLNASKIDAAQDCKNTKQAWKACLASPPAQDPEGRADSGDARLDRKKACVQEFGNVGRAECSQSGGGGGGARSVRFNRRTIR
jgi:hypothetical protein